MAETSDLQTQLEIEKQRLECEKLRAEIEQVRQPLWKRSGYIASLSPVVLASVAFLSAWVTGYFDTQRSQLNAEVESLTTLRDGLQSEVEAMRSEVDHVYLQLKAAVGEATYAVNHFAAYSGTAEQDVALKQIDTVEKSVPPILRPAVMPALTELRRDFESERRERAELVEILDLANVELERLRENLDRLPVSDWTEDMRHEVGLGTSMLRGADGRVYHLIERRHLDEDEAKALGLPGQ